MITAGWPLRGGRGKKKYKNTKKIVRTTKRYSSLAQVPTGGPVPGEGPECDGHNLPRDTALPYFTCQVRPAQQQQCVLHPFRGPIFSRIMQFHDHEERRERRHICANAGCHTSTYNHLPVDVPTGATPRPCSLISCLLLAQI